VCSTPPNRLGGTGGVLNSLLLSVMIGRRLVVVHHAHSGLGVHHSAVSRCVVFNVSLALLAHRNVSRFSTSTVAILLALSVSCDV
jgi:hypothetical protein